MKILSIDTASDVCGVSILEDKKSIISLDTNTGRTHSENLMPMIENAFNQTNLSLNDIELITCDIGPGSFTGLRIGIATTKAFCDFSSIPCVGISSLTSLAYNVLENIKDNDVVCSIIDCKNNNWLFTSQKSSWGSNKNEWLLSPYSSNSGCAARLYIEGSVFFYGSYDVSSHSFAVRPTFYLDSSVLKIVGTGDGTKDNAYRVG